MKTTLEEKIKYRLRRVARKNMFCFILMVPLIMISSFIFYAINYLKTNVKRISVLAMSALLFVICSSFSFPAFILGASANEFGDYRDFDIDLAEESNLSYDEVALLSDEDVLLEGNYYEFASYGEDFEDYDENDLMEIIENESIVDGEIPTSSSLHSSLETEYEFSKDDWELVLINKQHSIPEDYVVDLVKDPEKNLTCDKRILNNVLDMLNAAKEDGVILRICSPYRDMDRQTMLFNRKITTYMDKGMSYLEAYQKGSEAVTVPGASEHQLGLAFDIVCPSHVSLDEAFADTDAGKWLKDNCKDYGFILRYPSGKEYITGIEYEPWHFRYVGVNAATVIMNNEITLEEFWEEYLE